MKYLYFVEALHKKKYLENVPAYIVVNIYAD